MSSLYESLLDNQKVVLEEPLDFLKAAVGYFSWAENHPLQEEKIFQYQGEIIRDDSSKMRAFTKEGLAAKLRIPVSRIELYKSRDEKSGWPQAVQMVEQIIYEQTFTGAAAGLLNAHLVSRSLGLAEKSEVSGPNGGPIQTEEVSARDIINGKLARLVATSTEDTSGAD